MKKATPSKDAYAGYNGEFDRDIEDAAAALKVVQIGSLKVVIVNWLHAKLDRTI